MKVRVVGVFATLLVLFIAGAGASADAPESYGWWWKAQQAPGFVLPAPPYVPAGGLYVANDPTGPTAVSALRFTQAGTGGATLKLAAAQGSANAIADQVVACPLAAPFDASEAGAWAFVPQGDCETTAVAGVADADLATVTWKLTGAFEASEGTWSMVLTPAPGSLLPFQIAFNPPNATALTTTAPGGAATSDAPDAPPARAGSPASQPVTPAGPSSAGPPAGPALGGEQPGGVPAVAAPPVQEPAAASPPAPVARNDLRDRIIAAAVFGVIAISLWLIWLRQSDRGALLARIVPGRALPADGEVPEGGIGRFARHRERPPRRLW